MQSIAHLLRQLVEKRFIHATGILLDVLAISLLPLRPEPSHHARLPLGRRWRRWRWWWRRRWRRRRPWACGRDKRLPWARAQIRTARLRACSRYVRVDLVALLLVVLLQQPLRIHVNRQLRENKVGPLAHFGRGDIGDARRRLRLRIHLCGVASRNDTLPRPRIVPVQWLWRGAAWRGHPRGRRPRAW